MYFADNRNRWFARFEYAERNMDELMHNRTNGRFLGQTEAEQALIKRQNGVVGCDGAWK